MDCTSHLPYEFEECESILNDVFETLLKFTTETPKCC